MTRSEREREIARARERADLARLRFGNALHDVVHRIAPERLKEDALELASDQFELVKRDFLRRFPYWPFAIAPLFAGVAALLFWEPARAIFRQLLRIAGLVLTARKLLKGETT